MPAALMPPRRRRDAAATPPRRHRRNAAASPQVNRIKVHKVDGAQIAKPGKEKIKGGVGHVLGEDDDDPEMASPSPKKKPRVAGGATRQKKTDKALLKDDEIDYEDDETEKQAEGNDWLKQLAKERAQRR